MKQRNLFKKISALLVISIFFSIAMLAPASAGEQPNLSNELIQYNDAQLAGVTGSSGLWHSTTMDGKADVWYYGDETTMTYNVGSTATSGDLQMTFSTAGFISGNLMLDTKYQTESSTYWDKCQILIGSDIVWERSDTISGNDPFGSFNWEQLSIPISSYLSGDEITITFRFNTIDGGANDYFGWAIHNVKVLDPYSGASSDPTSPTTVQPQSVGLTVNQINMGNFPTVNALVTVKDSNGNFVSTLGDSNFTVKEAGSVILPVTVSLMQNNPLPLSLGLMVDQSGSMYGTTMTDAKAAVSDFIGMSTGPQDQFGIVSIGASSYSSSTAVNEVDVIQDFTTDKDALKAAVASLSADDMTPLYDGIAKTLELTAQQSGIKAVIAFTDGDDTYSKTYTSQSVIDYAKKLNIPVYTIGVGYVSSTILETIAIQTGGTYTAATSATELSAIYQKLQSNILQQYMLSFQSALSTGANPCYDISVILPDGTQYSAIQCELIPSTPAISLDADTNALFTTGPVTSTDLTIGAYISDADNDPIVNASLFYRIKGSVDNTFFKLDMEDLGSADPTHFTALVPGTFYTGTIEFYITASDGVNTRIAPAQGYYEIIPGSSPGTSPGSGITEQIFVLGPTDNDVLSYTTSGIDFLFTKINGAEKYVLYMGLSDMLTGSGMTIPLSFDLTPGTIWAPGTDGFTESFIGMSFKLPLPTATWDLLSKYNFTWGIEAFDASGNLIGSTYLNQIPEKYASSLKFISSSSIALTSPIPGAILSKQDAPPLFKWETYPGVSTYTFAAARIQSLGFDNVQLKGGLTFNVLSMDSSTWSGMPSGNWFWTVFGADAAGAALPADFTLFDFMIQ